MKAPSSTVRSVLVDAVVVHDDRAAAEARARADVGVADVRRGGRPSRRRRAWLFFTSTKLPMRTPAPSRLPGRRCADGPSATSSPTSRRLDHGVRLDAAALADARRSLDHAAGLDHGVAADLHVPVEIGRVGIDQRHAFVHHALARCGGAARAAARASSARELMPSASSASSSGIASIARPSRTAIADDVGQIDLALRVLVVDLVERLPEELGVDEVGAGVAFRDAQLVGRRVGHLDDALDAPCRVAHDAAGQRLQRGEDQQVDTARASSRRACARSSRRAAAACRRRGSARRREKPSSAARVCITAWPVPRRSVCSTKVARPAKASRTRSLSRPTTTTSRSGAERLGDLDRVGEHRPAAELVEHLREPRLHPLALAGGQDHDGEGAARRLHGRPSRPIGPGSIELKAIRGCVADRLRIARGTGALEGTRRVAICGAGPDEPALGAAARSPLGMTPGGDREPTGVRGFLGLTLGRTEHAEPEEIHPDLRQHPGPEGQPGSSPRAPLPAPASRRPPRHAGIRARADRDLARDRPRGRRAGRSARRRHPRDGRQSDPRSRCPSGAACAPARDACAACAASTPISATSRSPTTT